MAHFAKLGTGNIVEQVIVIQNSIITDNNGNEQEQLGVDFINNLYGTRDAFIPPKPYNSWTLNETTCGWEPPVSYPSDGKKYQWNDTDKQWDLLT